MLAYRGLVLSSISPTSQWLVRRASCSLRIGKKPSGVGMGRLFRLAFLAMFALVLSAASASATTYYIAANGSDSNDGLSKTSPWAHMPGMRTWTGTQTPRPGDTLILRGCDTWGNSSFPIKWTWSGTSTSNITVDRDTSWYNTASCSAWNRAIFDAQGTAIQAPECNGSNLNWFMLVNSATFVTFRWIETRNFYWNTDANGSCFGTSGLVEMNLSDYITLDSWYFHAWSHGSSAKDNDHMLTVQNGSPFCEHCMLTNSIMQNADGDDNSGGGVQIQATNNVLHDLVNALKPFVKGVYANNNIYANQNGFAGDHPNCIETVGAHGANPAYYFYNNLIHDQTPSGGCEVLQVGNPGEIDYIWNNIWYNNNSNGSNQPDLPQGGNNSDSFYFWNNVIVNTGSSCISVGTNGNKWSNAFVAENNLCLTAGTPSGAYNGLIDNAVTGASTITVQNNIVESQAAAASQMLTSNTRYVYSPQSGNCNNISANCINGAGINLTSLCTGPLAGVCTDTAYSCVQQTVNGVVESVCNQRTPVARPTSGAWDVGAYSYSSGTGGGGTATKPNPPTGLTAAVQ
jgi:hypothetical protein